MAFVSGVSVALSRPSTSFAGCRLARAPARASRGPTMSMSSSVPFLEKPPKLDGSLPGDVGFDPLGFSNMFDLNFLRESEVKHGRVCMLAIVGWFFPEVVYHLPAAQYSAVNPLEAPGMVGFASYAQILLFIAVVEAATWEKCYSALGLSKNPATKQRMQLAEIKNGRLAMCAIGGAIHHSILTHQGMFEQINAGNWFGGAYRPF